MPTCLDDFTQGPSLLRRNRGALLRFVGSEFIIYERNQTNPSSLLTGFIGQGDRNGAQRGTSNRSWPLLWLRPQPLARFVEDDLQAKHDGILAAWRRNTAGCWLETFGRKYKEK
jgi:hypothetical protein